MKYRATAKVCARVRGGTVGTGWALLALLAVLAVAVPSCNLFNDLGDAWCNADEDGAGGDDGAGGADDGFGGSDVGTNAGGSDVGVGAGVGGSFGDAVGSGVGAGAGPGSSDVGAGAGPARGVPRRVAHVRRRHNRGGLGTAVSADCSGQPQQNYIPPPPSRMPNWQPLTTMKLRWIAAQNGIGAGQTGITQSHTIGVAFEAWVLKTMRQLPRWTMPIFSLERQTENTNNGHLGLPASVIPEFVDNQVGVTLGFMSMKTVYFDQSVFFEVKAVTGALTLGTSQYQILGLLNVAQNAAIKAAPQAPTQMLPPPIVFFTTTGNTTVSPSVVAKGTAWGVGVWQQQVLYDANSANPNNPNLSLGDQLCLNPGLYAGWVASWPAPGPFPSNPLTWPTDQEQASVVVGGDPDPAEVD